MKIQNWKKYTFEFLSIFIAVVSAFALNNWNENRRDNEAANKILQEISNGLTKDIHDININVGGHKSGIAACNYWRRLIARQTASADSLEQHYLNLTRDFFSAQNRSGYETLKSRGLELIQNDSLRYEIISLYEYDYNSLRKFEEEYVEMQFQQSYFKEINAYISDKFEFDGNGRIINISVPLKLSTTEEKTFLSYLWKIEMNRKFILRYYSEIENKINHLKEHIQRELQN